MFSSGAQGVSDFSLCSFFNQNAYVPLVVMDHVMSWADVSVMQVTREASATAVQMATMAFPTARVSDSTRHHDVVLRILPRT